MTLTRRQRIEALKLAEEKIRAVRQSLEEIERRENYEAYMRKYNDGVMSLSR